MCGIVVVKGEASEKIALDGLKRLEYRGYDSYGFAYLSRPHELAILRSTDLLDPETVHIPPSQIVVGHTRWATHGAVNIDNCHPHLADDGQLALVHNGVVDNFFDLKQDLLEQGHRFQSSTDSEVILKLIMNQLDDGRSRLDAVQQTLSQIQGRNTFVCLFSDGEIVAVKKGSPLVVGRKVLSSNEMRITIASDVLAFGEYGIEVVALDEEQLLVIKATGELAFYKAADKLLSVCAGNWRLLEEDNTDQNWTQSILKDKSNQPAEAFRYFMLKEIFEQWRTIPLQMNLAADDFSGLIQLLRKKRLLIITGAGGAYYTAQQIAWMLRTIAGVPAISVPAYEMRNIQALVDPDCFLIAVSQSGETADTLDAIGVARSWQMGVACVVNMPFSTMAREADISFQQKLGPEECVLSTKSASAQITFGYLLAMALAGEGERSQLLLNEVSHVLSHALDRQKMVDFVSAAKYLAGKKNVFVLGRNEHFANALIGALNIKEASYLHAEAFSAGELKHGVIALIEEGTPVILFMPDGDLYLRNVAEEVKARGAYLIGIGAGKGICDISLPMFAQGALVSAIIPCQLLAYYIAIEKGLNPDRPRNLAKSVTVQ